MKYLVLAVALCGVLRAYAQSPLSKAVQHYNNKQYDQAVALLKPIKENDRDYAEARYYLGRAAYDQQHYDEAMEYFEEAIETNDKSAAYHFWLGNAMGSIAKDANPLRQGMLAPKIKNEFERTVQLDPSYTDAYWGLVDFYTLAPGFMGGSWQKAYESAQKLKKQNEVEGLVASGIVYEREEKFPDAEQQFVEAAAKDKQYGRRSLVNYYIRRNQFAKCFEVYEQTLKENPNDMITVYLIGRTSAISGTNFTRGEECLKRYLTYTPQPNEPSHAGAHMRLAMIAEKRGQKAEAKKYYETSLKLDPNLKESKEGLARVSK
jgi:tetratricopeptide (TPR) repeat protein